MKLHVKITTWQEIELNQDENVSLEEITELLNKYGPSELWDDENERFSPSYENLTETEEYMSVEENGGCATMELYDDDMKLLWSNSNCKQ